MAEILVNCQSSVIVEKHKNCMRLRLLGDKKANQTKNIGEVMFSRGGGVSEIQCSLYHQNNFDPF